jgi:hypothetical protein
VLKARHLFESDHRHQQSNCGCSNDLEKAREAHGHRNGHQQPLLLSFNPALLVIAGETMLM